MICGLLADGSVHRVDVLDGQLIGSPVIVTGDDDGYVGRFDALRVPLSAGH